MPESRLSTMPSHPKNPRIMLKVIMYYMVVPVKKTVSYHSLLVVITSWSVY